MTDSRYLTLWCATEADIATAKQILMDHGANEGSITVNQSGTLYGVCGRVTDDYGANVTYARWKAGKV